MENIQKWSEFNEDNEIEMIFGEQDTLYIGFDIDTAEEKEYLENNHVKLTITGFAEEWVEYVNYDLSYAFISNNKLHVKVYGIPDIFNEKIVIEYYTRTIEQYLITEYGEFFETLPGCPICAIVEYNGSRILI